MSNGTSVWTTLVPVIIGAVIGIVGSLATSMYLEYTRRKAEQLSLTGAIVSEISALIKISERRRYADGIRQEIAWLKTGSDPNRIGRFYFSARRNPFQVYDATLARIGILRHPLPQLVARFYAQASSILEDIADMRELKEKSSPNREISIHRLEQLLQLFEDTHALGNKIITDTSSELTKG